MQLAYTDNLDWNVISRDLTYRVDGLQYTVPGKVAQVRQDTNQVIGITSPSYEVFQNDSLKGLIMPAVEEGLLEITNMGVIKNGSRVFIQATLAADYRVVGEEYKGMITLLNSHDGSSALACGTTSQRVICSNTFASALSDFSTRFAHNRNIHANAETIVDIINFVDEGMKKYSQAVEALASHRLVGSEMDDVIETVFGKQKESVRAYNKIVSFTRNGIGTEGKTLYDLFNGFTQYATHEATKDDSKRFLSNNFGNNNKVVRRAMNTMLALV